MKRFFHAGPWARGRGEKRDMKRLRQVCKRRYGRERVVTSQRN
jgi:hypothetical protein